MSVSVIVRTYNRGYIVADAVRSILSQTMSDLEVVVVDDGSTDDTLAVLAQLDDDRVRVVRHGTNRGVSAAGNTGIRAARGDLIAHLDSDDLWHRTILETLVDFLDRHPEADAVFCGLEIERSGHAASPPPPTAFDELVARLGDPAEVLFAARDMYLCLLETEPITPCTVLIRRDVLQRAHGYDEAWRSGEDWELYLRMAREGCRFGFVNQTLATIRVQADSTLGKFQIEDKRALIGMALAELRATRGDDEAQRALRRALASHYDILGHHYRGSGRRLQAAATYAEGFARTRRTRLAVRAGASALPTSLLDGLRKTVAARSS
jgi:glycosyltransferase involved in cell wall biosynthesis